MADTVADDPGHRGRRVRRLLTAGLVLVFVLGAGTEAGGQAPSAGSAGNGASEERLTKFERDILALQKRLRASREADQSGQADVRAAAEETIAPVSAGDEIELRLNAIEKAIQQLTRMAEENAHQVQRQSQRLERLQNDLVYRVEQLEAAAAEQGTGADGGRAGAAEAVAPGTASTGEPTEPAPQPMRSLTAAPPPEPPPAERTASARVVPEAAAVPPAEDRPRDAQAAYAAAFDLLRTQDYAAAETAFEAFLADHPDHLLAENAHYWLGETHYARRRFEDAARSFASGYKAAPAGRKAPDNLLKLGLSLQALDRTDEACLVLQRLQTDFSTVSGSMLARVRRTRDAMHCP